MLDLIIAILGIIITILLIVGIHEFGHFIVARWVGIKVLRFSIGFGKTLFHWYDKKGTEYVFAAIPLGGYVKMLDETEDSVPADQVHLAYNRQPVYKKVAVVIAGPLSNLIFALFLYWIVFMVGFTTLIPLIGKVEPGSIAAHAGLQANEEITKINNHQTLSWTSVVMRLLVFIGDNNQIDMETKTLHSSEVKSHKLDLTGWHLDELKPDPLASLGIAPYQPIIPTIIGKIMPESPAAKSKLEENDKIISIADTDTKSWHEALEIISKHPDQLLLFKIERQGKLINIPVLIGSKTDFFSKSGFLGITPKNTWPKELLRLTQYAPLSALAHAAQNTYDLVNLNFLLLGKMLTRKLSLQSLGGPITIFESAGTALTVGILPFISFLAFLSIAIGVINILPIPGLDGGHLLFHAIEAIKRRPLSIKVQVLFYRLGLILLLLLLVQALVNDIMRL